MRANRDKRELVTRNQQMLAMKRERKTLREIAAAFHVSTVRAYQIVTREAERQRTMLAGIRD
jgi:DNA-directed RNA polymerase specialized sigma subunit